ncbi:MAG: GTPase, partial [Acidimicrobiales bacterium]
MTSPEHAHADLEIRVDALSAAVGIAERRLPGPPTVAAQDLVERVRGRLRHGTSHTVVALAGPTGAGKSTLFNALTGAEVSSTGVRRPTTSSTHAAMWGADASDLLDWLGVDRRHQCEDDPALDGLVLLDLPDFDSTERTHQIEVDRLVELVDLFIWVLDPQKYADQSLHEQYLRPLSGHGEVMRFLLNKADTIADPSLVVADFEMRLVEDGISGAVVRALSATNGDGIEQAREL